MVAEKEGEVFAATGLVDVSNYVLFVQQHLCYCAAKHNFTHPQNVLWQACCMYIVYALDLVQGGGNSSERVRNKIKLGCPVYLVRAKNVSRVGPASVWLFCIWTNPNSEQQTREANCKIYSDAVHSDGT